MPLSLSMLIRNAVILCVATIAAPGTTQAAQSELVRRDHLSAQLIAAERVVEPGTTTLVGLRLVHDPEWHTYWRNPGDSGLPTKLEWSVADDVTVTEIDWPTPHRIEVGPLVNFGYDGEVVLPVRVEIPASVSEQTQVPLKVKASWLVCREECIPGSAEFDLKLDVGSTRAVDTNWASLFDAARATQATQVAWSAKWIDAGDSVDLVIDDAGTVTDLATSEIFPAIPTLIAHARGTAERLPDGTLRVRTAKSDSFEVPVDAVPFLFVSEQDGSRKAFSVAAVSSAAVASESPPAPTAQPTILFAVFLALIGGLLLNLMPCVLPVLSLKALALAEHAHDTRRARQHGLLYFAGTLACFIALASVLLILRSAGESLGWGFQLQTPWVIAVLAMLMTVMGLSLSGAFQLGTSWMGVGQNLTEGSGARSAFFSGALAAIVASPCTAPFMGPALGFAVTQPAPVALGVFAALATGLALPIVLLSFAPALAKFLPRPGVWMERLKQILAYPLYLTAIWLLWVLGRQLGADGMALGLIAIVALIFGMTLWNASERFGLSRVVAIVAIVGAAFAVMTLDGTRTQDANASTSAQSWKPWSASEFESLRERGEPVFVNMTAAWCITCLANERVALSSATVKDRLAELGITYLKGDWTNRDAAITTYLSEFGRNGVPLYVLYPRGNGAPEVLPQLLTPAIVDAALQRAVTPAATSD